MRGFGVGYHRYRALYRNLGKSQLIFYFTDLKRIFFNKNTDSVQTNGKSLFVPVIKAALLDRRNSIVEKMCQHQMWIFDPVL